MYFLFCPLRPLTEGIHIKHTLNIDTPENLINHLFSLCDCLCDFVCSPPRADDLTIVSVVIGGVPMMHGFGIFES